MRLGSARRGRVGWLAAAVAAATLLAAGLDGDAGLHSWWTLRSDLRSAEARIAELRREIAQLDREASELEEDPFALERAIRERLGYVRPGETLVRLRRFDDANPRIP